MDPYRGTVLGKLSRLQEIMHTLVEWHRWLGSREVGRPITGACSLAFMGLALSGLYLWWPRSWTRHALRDIVWFAPSLRGQARSPARLEVGGPAGQTIALPASAGGVMLVWTGLALAWRRFRSWRQRAREVARARSRGVTAAVALALALGGGAADAADESLERGLAAIRSLTGCFLVDYSFVEVESLRAGYARDPRVYDVNRDKSVKEWITAETLSPRRVRLQRILFAADLAGAVRAESLLRHQSEDWEHDAPFRYDFVAPQTWQVHDLRASPGLWTRRITNLDDGLRYQCASGWTTTGGYPEWSCANYAPIPGRESRDMGRTDYHTLQRGTRIVAYGSSWLERQDNVKTVHAGGTRTPLARELGKTWYVRLPDAECAAAVPFARDGRAFWTLLREIWDEVLSGDAPFVERTPPGQPPRFVRMYEIEEEYQGRDLSDPAVREAARTRILRLIGEYRAQ